MLDEKNVYAQDAGKNNFLTMTREQILTAITQAVNEGTIGDIDAGFITKLQEMNEQTVVQFWFGTTAEFQALTEKRENMLYILTDDTTLDDVSRHIQNAYDAVVSVENSVAAIVDGSQSVGVAKRIAGAKVIEFTDNNYGMAAHDVSHKFKNGFRYVVKITPSNQELLRKRSFITEGIACIQVDGEKISIPCAPVSFTFDDYVGKMEQFNIMITQDVTETGGTYSTMIDIYSLMRVTTGGQNVEIGAHSMCFNIEIYEMEQVIS